MQITNVKGRKAISPVIATVILIAITLIAAIAIAGFVFGLFGSFTSTAQVSVTVVSCTVANPPVCSITLSNSGTANTAVIGTAGGFSLTYGGAKYTGICGTAPTITAGSTAVASCTATGGVLPVAGEQFVGTVSLTNGGSISLTGTF